MKTLTIQNAELPGLFAIHAESAAEILLLRTFANWPSLVKECCTLGILSHGGNSSEGAYSVTIGWRKDAMDSPAPAPTSEVDDQEKQYPETRCTDALLLRYSDVFDCNKPKIAHAAAIESVANAALRHAIDAGQVAPKEAYDQCSRDLGKAERLLESLGYRSAGDGEWMPPNGRHFYGQINGFHVEGDESSIKVVEGLAERGAARDMAIAEAVIAEAQRLADIYSTSCGRQLRDHLKPEAIIAKVLLP